MATISVCESWPRFLAVRIFATVRESQLVTDSGTAIVAVYRGDYQRATGTVSVAAVLCGVSAVLFGKHVGANDRCGVEGTMLR